MSTVILQLSRIQWSALMDLVLERMRDTDSDKVREWVDIVKDETVTIEELFALLSRFT